MSSVSQQRALDSGAGGPPRALPAPAMGWRYFPAEILVTRLSGGRQRQRAEDTVPKQ